MGTNIIKEVSVMRYNEDSSEIVGKEVLTAHAENDKEPEQESRGEDQGTSGIH